MELWIQTDAAEDVAGSLRHLLRCRDIAPSDQQAWKWIALSLHSAIQGAWVCHLFTTAGPIGAVTKRNKVEWLAYFEEGRSNPNTIRPQTYLMALPDLLKAIRKPESEGDGSNVGGVMLSDEELTSLNQFHESIRNQFVHFEPLGWSLEVSGIPELAQLIARLIFEIIEAGWAFRHKKEHWKQFLVSDLAELSTWSLVHDTN